MIANNLSAGAVRLFVVKYWFQLCLGGLAIFIFLRKDLSFSVSFRAPIESVAGSKQKQTGGLAAQKKGENTAENVLQAAASSEKAGVLSWSKSGEKDDNLRQWNDETSSAAKKSFVQRFLSIAQAENQKFGIPASIILAQGILQTQAGQNPLAERGNNFFKLRATADWQGKTYRAKTGVYRAYPSAWAGFRDHSEYLTSGEYRKLTALGSKNYTAWAQALEATGFSKESNYAQKLVSIIETEHLAQYDK